MIMWLQSVGAPAEVVDAAAGGFAVKNSIEISATPQRVYDAIVSQTGSWWNSTHTFSGNSKNLSIDATPGGCFCERWDGKAGVRHMTVVYADPGKRLRLSGSLGPLQDTGVTGSMTFSLVQADGKTKLDLIYNVGEYSPNGLNRLAPVVDSVLLEQITRLKRFVETGIPDPK
jgi:uncharacterized protein YndB with AHSA1/START domain